MTTKYKVWDTDTKTLDRIWRDWISKQLGPNSIFETHYSTVVRSSVKAYKFEEWLYDQGAFIVENTGERFIRFYQEDRAVMFMLKNS